MTVKDNKLMSQTVRIYNNIERSMIPFNRMSEISRQMSRLKTVTCAISKTRIPSFDSGVMSKLQDYSNIINKVKGPMMAADTVRQIAEAANFPLKSLMPIQNMIKSSSTLSHFASEQAGIMTSLKTITIANKVLNGAGVVRSLYRMSPLVTLGLGKEFAGIDFDRLSGITDRVLSTLDTDRTTETADSQVESVIKKIADDYNSHTDENSTGKNEAKNKLTPKEVWNWIEHIITILASIITIVTPLMSNAISPKIIYNQKVMITKVYCRDICMYDPLDLNNDQYRIINRNIIARLGHDCHSRVTGRLDAGDVVRIVRKYKKWRLIMWNDGEKECTGWVQNYKLSQF